MTGMLNGRRVFNKMDNHPLDCSYKAEFLIDHDTHEKLDGAITINQTTTIVEDLVPLKPDSRVIEKDGFIIIDLDVIMEEWKIANAKILNIEKEVVATIVPEVKSKKQLRKEKKQANREKQREGELAKMEREKNGVTAKQKPPKASKKAKSTISNLFNVYGIILTNISQKNLVKWLHSKL